MAFGKRTSPSGGTTTAADADVQGTIGRVTTGDPPSLLDSTGVPGLDLLPDHLRTAVAELSQLLLEAHDAMLASSSGRIRAETLLISTGAIAGYAGQMVIAKQAEAAGDLKRGITFDLMTLPSGERHIVGKLFDQFSEEAALQGARASFPLPLVVNGQLAQWGVPKHQLVAIDAVVGHCERELRLDRFGNFSVLDQTALLPLRQLLPMSWRVAYGYFQGAPGREDKACPMATWPIVAAFVALDHFKRSKSLLEPEAGAVLVLEAAVFASRVDMTTMPELRRTIQ